MDEGSYEYLEHTAEAKIRACGPSLGAAFSACGRGLVGLVTPHPERIAAHLDRPVRLEAIDLESLLFDYLHAIIVAMDRDDLLLAHTRELHLQEGPPWRLTGVLCGDLLDRYPCCGQVKAVTYSDMRIERGVEACIVEVVVDV